MRAPALGPRAALVATAVGVALLVVYVAWRLNAPAPGPRGAPGAPLGDGAVPAVQGRGRSASHPSAHGAEVGGAGERGPLAPAASRAASAQGARVALGPDSAADGESEGELVLWTGVVVGALDALPIAEAAIGLVEPATAANADIDDAEPSARTGPDGAFELAWPSERPAHVIVAHPEHLTARFALDRERTAVTLVPAARIVGRVRGPGLGGEAGAALAQVVLWTEARDVEGQRDVRTLAVDEQGNFAFGGLDSGVYGLAAAAAESAVAVRAGLALAAGEVTELELELPRGARLAGRVLRNTSHAAVEGAALSLVWRPDGLPSDVAAVFERHATTRSSGGFELAGLSPGATTVVLATPWGTEQRARVEPRASGERLERDFFVGERASCSGQVIGADRQGAAGARVVVLKGESGEGPLDEAALLAHEVHATDAAGRFELVDLDPEERLVLVALPRPGDAALRAGAPRSLRLRADEQRERFDLELVAVGHLSGIVVDARDPGRALAGATVELESHAAGTALAGGATTTDAGGRFGSDTAAGRVVVRIAAEGYAPLERTVRVTPGEGGAEERFELEPAGSVTWSVVDEQGYAVAGARVRLMERDEQGKRRRTRLARTDAAGSASFDALPLGTWEAAAWADGFALVEVEPERFDLVDDAIEVTAELERERPRRATLRGWVVVERADPLPSGLRFDGAGGAVVVADGGRFEISGLRARRTSLLVRADRCVPLRISADLTDGGVVDLGIVELESATRLEARVALKGGKDVRGARVLLREKQAKDRRARKPAVLDLKEVGPGRYRTDEAYAGSWTLEVRRKGEPTHRETVELRGRAREVVDVTVR